MTALIEGMFAFVWFGWGQANVTDTGVRVLLAMGGVAGLAVAVVGAVMALRRPRETTVLHEQGAFRAYGIAVGIEFVIAALGAATLIVLGYAAYTPVWVLAVVGVHFFPLSTILRDRSLPLLGVLMLGVAVAALCFGLFTDVAPSTVTGLGAGALLLAFGARALALRASSAVRAAPADYALHEARH